MRIAVVLVAFLAGSGAAVAAVPAAKAPAEKPAQKGLDSLFTALAKAGSAEEAKPIEERILAQFLQSGSPSIDLLMNRAAAALQAGDLKTA
jgi:hypothetical protein